MSPAGAPSLAGDPGSQRDGRAAVVGQLEPVRAAGRGHHAAVPDPDRLRAATGSVTNADIIALRSFAGFLAEAAPEITSTAQVTRRHIEDYKP